MLDAYGAESLQLADADTAEQIWNQACQQLRRDLHDSVGPLLSAVTMRTEVASAIVTRDPQAAKSLLAELHADACSALAEVRRLAGTKPEVVPRETCLEAALRCQAHRFRQASGGRLAVTVTVAPMARDIPGVVENAIFRIASEALTNAARHAHATRCPIRVWTDDDAVHIEVIDDGVGLPRRPRPGVGLTSMRDRAHELGGHCVVENVVPHGTRIYATMPTTGRPITGRPVTGRPVTGRPISQR
jgi:two-component system NarL family sensor kinase